VTEEVEVGGHVAPGFEGVRDAFAHNFVEHGEEGASYAFYVGGTKVVDIWGGVRDDTGAPYGEDTLQIVFSSTKGATAVCAHLLAERGLLDIDAPVVTYWPEFGQAGKETIPVRWLLTHQAGLPTVDARLTRAEALAWEPVIRALEVQLPLWEPGVAHGYHALTYGHLVGEVVRRIDGRSLGTFFHDEIAAPYGLEFWIGLPEEQRMYAGLVGPVDGGPSEALLSREQIDVARALQVSGADQVLSFPGLEVESTIALGFWSASPFAPMGGASAFGHYGAGGSVGFADPEHQLAGGYVMSKMGLGISADPRSSALIRASYEAAGAEITHV
jgi:CubicO group peptidase (beta-lactamase class C family)